MMIKSRIVIALTAAIMLPGCLSLLPQVRSAPSIYKLNAPAQIVEKALNAPVIMINRPITSKAINGEDIVLSPDGQRIAYAANARWIEPVPNLLQQAAADAFAIKTGVSTVASPSTVRADYRLQINVRVFEAEFDQGQKSAPLAKVLFTATLTSTQNRTLISSKQFAATQRSVDINVGDIVKAKRIATQSALSDMADWVEVLAKAQS